MNRSLFCLMLLAHINVVGIALPYPILSPLFLNGNFETITNISPLMTIMIVIGLYPFGQFIGSPIFGASADRFGPKKVIIISMFLTALGYMSTAYALSIENVTLLCLTRFLTGFAEGNFGVLRAEVSKLATNSIDRIKYFGIFHAAATMGWVIGPTLGSFLSNHSISPLLSSSTPFIFGGFICFVSLFIAMICLKKTHYPKINSLSLSDTSSLISKVPNIRPMLLVSFLMTLAIDGFYEFYPAFLTANNESDSHNIAINTIFSTIGMIISQTLIVQYLKHQLYSYLIPSLLIFIGIFNMLFFIESSMLYFSFTIIGIGIGVLTTLTPAYISNSTPHNLQGTIMGTMASLRSLGDAFICIAFGFLGELRLYLPMLLIAVIIVAASIKFARICENSRLVAYSK